MKLNSLILAAATLTALATPQAKACDFEIHGPGDVAFAISSAPLLTTLVTATSCRDEGLNLKEAAIEYRMSGNMSPVLQSSIDAVQKNQNLTTETIIDLLINSKLGAE